MPTEIAIAVVEHAGRYLIGQRPAKSSLAGLWEFPGGKVEAGETPAQAAVRECLEETGLLITVVGEYLSHDQSYAHDDLRLHFLDCRLHGERAEPNTPFRWVHRQALRDYPFPRGNDRLLALLTSSVPSNDGANSTG